MKILKTSKDLEAKEVYFLTRCPAAQKMSSAVGSTLELSAWCFYEDEDSKGATQTLFSCLTVDGEVFTTNSPTFIKDVEDMVDLFVCDYGMNINSIQVMQGTSKAGRPFIFAVYAG